MSSVQKESYSGEGPHSSTDLQYCSNIHYLCGERGEKKKKKKREKEKGKERYGRFSILALVNLFDYQIQVLPQQCLMSKNLMEI